MTGEVRFTLTEADYVAANRDWFRLHLRSRRGMLGGAAALASCAAIGAVTASLDGEPVLFMALAFALLGLVLLILGYGVAYLMLGRTARRLYRQQKAIQLPQHWRWGDEGLRVETPDGITRIGWPDLYRWALGRRALLLFLNERLFYVLPRRALGSESEAGLQSLLRSRSGPRGTALVAGDASS